MWRGKAGQTPAQGAEKASPTPALEFPDDQVVGPQFDDSDWPTELRGFNGSQKITNITSSFANQLLLVSLLEHLCHIYAQDPTRSRRLFQLLCKTFTQMRLLPDFAVCEEFSSLRLQHNRAIATLMKAANKQILNEEFGNGNPCTNREDILFEAQTSRYINEFDEISRLGKGGYGTVYKVRNKLDGQFYAIKKILIKKATKRDCMKVLREVKVLAGLQHPNIVGYHTAWMEHVQPTCLKVIGESNLNLPSLKVCCEQGSSVDPFCDQDMKDSSSIVFADLNPEDSVDGNSERNAVRKLHKNSCSNASSSISKYNENPASIVPHGDQDQHNMSTNDSYSGEQLSQKGISLQQQCEMEYHLMLHIQMQLCEISLWDWIADRNKSCFKAEGASSPYHHIDSQGTLKIFQELLEGVYYIHNKEVMHRDIKLSLSPPAPS